MNARVLRLLIPFGISAVLLYLVFRSVQSEASQLTGSQLSDQLFATLGAAQAADNNLLTISAAEKY